MVEDKTYYDLLGVDPQVEAKDLRKAYHSLMKVHHPDQGGGPESEELAKALNEAYTVLSDPVKRETYDLTLNPGSNVPSPEEEEFVPSWGKEEAWVFPQAPRFQEHPFEKPTDIFPPPPPRPAPQPLGGDLPRPTIPEGLLQGKMTYRGQGWLMGLLLALPALFLTLLVFFPPFVWDLYGIFFLAAALVTPGIYLRGRKRGPRFKTWRTFLLLGGLLALLVAAVAWVIPAPFSLLALLAAAGPGAALYVSPRFWHIFTESVILRGKDLKKNNSFGHETGGPVEALLEDVVSTLWGVKGVRVFRVRNQAFTHMVFFNKRVVLLKGLYLPTRGEVRTSGPHVLLRRGDGTYADLLQGYTGTLDRFRTRLGRKVEVFPMLVVMPERNWVPSPVDLPGVHLITPREAPQALADLLFAGTTKNRVEGGFIREAYLAAQEV